MSDTDEDRPGKNADKVDMEWSMMVGERLGDDETVVDSCVGESMGCTVAFKKEGAGGDDRLVSVPPKGKALIITAATIPASKQASKRSR